jgi:predicted SAM-dependent methyltransferase
MSEKVKLNLGSGNRELVGYENIDRIHGTEVYPLDYDDASVSEIRASHVLEHFSHRDAFGVIQHWVDKLEPGGCLKIAVPNFLKIAQDYVDGKPLNVNGYVHGGHTDENDVHGVSFDEELLRELFINAGLERICRWEDEAQDCHKLPISLNLMGVKPVSDLKQFEEGDRVTACLAAPRVGFVPHFRCIIESMHALRVQTKIITGCFWHKNISKAMEADLKAGSDYIITMDYDTIFSQEEVFELYRLMKAFPDADAITSVQSKRQSDIPLMGIGKEHKFQKEGQGVPAAIFEQNLTPITTGHFGLTIFRADSLRSFPRPWMNDVPNDDGEWEDGCVDSDITFWLKWRDEGKSLYLANKVIVGHIEEMITWPGKEKFKPVTQYMSDYSKNGMPSEVERT